MLTRFLRRTGSPPPSVPPGRRLYAIGDIHGRIDLLEKLLLAIESDQQASGGPKPEIILLGDLIDRGPDSAAVVRRAMNPPAWADMMTLMGNHEDTMVEAVHGDREAMRRWLRFGGREALRSWRVSNHILDGGTIEDIIMAARDHIPGTELAWLGRLRQNILIGDYFFVHAGVRPGVSLEQQSPRDSYWIREEFLDSRRDHGAIVVHGHSIFSEVIEKDNRIGIDTGAYATSRLTALGLESTRRWLLQT